MSGKFPRRIYLPFLLCLGVVYGSLAGQTVRVSSLDETRYTHENPSCSSLSFSLSEGVVLSSVRSDLTNPAHFGPDGIVPERLDLERAVSVINGGILLDSDMMIWYASVGDSVPAPSEVAWLGRFVRQGGGLVVFGNRAAEHFSSILLGVESGGCDSTSQSQITNADSPIANGPFGQITQGFTLSNGFACSFSDVGPAGIAAIRNTAGVMAASFEVGLGRVVIFNDEELFWSTGASGCGSAHYDGNKKKLLLNAVAYVIPDPDFAFNPCSDDLMGNINADCLIDVGDMNFLGKEWLLSGANILADVNCDARVDFFDFQQISTHWLGVDHLCSELP